MFRKVWASLGIGSTQVDTRLEKSSYRQGELVCGDIFVRGGKSEQKIDSIYMYLILQNYLDDQQDEYVLDEFLLTDSFVIGEQETKMVPFKFQLPYDTPVTTGGSPIYLKTGLDVKMAVDPDDHDGFEVLPDLQVDKILQAVETIGFQLSGIEFDYETYHNRHPFVQKYKFLPQGEYEGIIDEIKMFFNPFPNEVDVTIQVNSKAVDLKSSMEKALRLDERFVRFTIPHNQTDRSNLIESHIQKCIS